MRHPSVSDESTWWTEIRRAAVGSPPAREDFVRRYQPVVQAYLRARWRQSSMLADLDDAVQNVFLECLRPEGVLERAEERRPGGFRAFLHGVTRNVAARLESRRPKDAEVDSAVAGALATSPDEDPERVFARAWSQAMLADAHGLMNARAHVLGEAALRRLEILRLRFEDDLPVREIASRLAMPGPHAHKQYALARDEFRACLREVVAFHRGEHGPGLDEECEELIRSV